MTAKARLTITRSGALNDSGGTEFERRVEELLRGFEGERLVVVLIDRPEPADEPMYEDVVMVHAYGNWTRDYPLGKILRGIGRRIHRRARETTP